ncbi:unnamed protein product [Rotaria sp. Silwood2]|nr:unnamed protein product [Rotaria sp. Silwood2]CAF3068926.1 unnamed protein product [Rotaria sp. Silwood2]CAF3871271.1 unnamed protein product [Rotaria sp. Silwood2]CAF3936725.1 unnamed protein product [Rotaria sp. Silwood2]CAF4166634.1 unnamed protein product [Rotaria sp. Silwood2]
MTRFSCKRKKRENFEESPTTESAPPTNEQNGDAMYQIDIPSRKLSIYTVEKLNERYNLNQDFRDNPAAGTWNYIKKYYKPTPAFFKRQLFKRIPFIDWIRHYNVKEWLLSDIVSGLTIGIVHIPQGLAYAILAGLPPVTGLYVSFFPVILYAFLGTSRHLSIGTFAVSSLMILAAINSRVGTLIPPNRVVSSIQNTTSSYGDMNVTTLDYTQEYTSNTLGSTIASIASTIRSSSDHRYLSDDPAEARIMVATALALVAGLIHLAMAILHFGYVTVYLSDSIVQGFTTGCSIHIITSQIPSLLGIKIKTVTGQSKVIKNWIEIFKNIKYSNGATCIIAGISIALFAGVRDQINERFKGRMPMPVPIELIIVVLGTGLSAAFDFNKRWKVNIVGSLPLGIPPPTVPPMAAISDVVGDAIAIAIVCFVINISMAKLFATKYKYQISPNQELFSYAVGNIVTSFFRGFPSCVALSRCAVLEGTGGKTQIVGLLASIVVLIVILVVGPLFRTLPNACLAAIIVAAMKNMLLQTKQLPVLWRINKLEFLAWIITFLGVVFLDVDYGLYVGVAAMIFLLIIRSQRPHATSLGYLSSPRVYEDKNAYPTAIDIPNIKIFRFEENIYYANVDMFKKLFIKRIDFRVDDQIKAMNDEIMIIEGEYRSRLAKPNNTLMKFKRRFQKENTTNTNETVADESIEIDESKIIEEKNEKIEEIRKSYRPNFDHIIIDCSPVNYMDMMGIKALIQIFKDFKEIGVTILLCQVRPTIYQQLKRMSYMDVAGRETIHVTINDAVMHALKARASRDSIVYVPGAPVTHIGIENAAYVDDVDENDDTNFENKIDIAIVDKVLLEPG